MSIPLVNTSSSEILKEAKRALEKAKAYNSPRRINKDLEKAAQLEDKILKINAFWTDYEAKSNASLFNRAISFLKKTKSQEIKVIHAPVAKRYFDQLPFELLLLIFQRLGYHELTAASKVCKQWRFIAESDLFCRMEMRLYFPDLCDSKHSVYDLAKGFRNCIPLAARLAENKQTLERIERKIHLTVSFSIVSLSLSIQLLSPYISEGFDKFVAWREARFEAYLKDVGMTREAYYEMMRQYHQEWVNEYVRHGCYNI